MSVTNLANWDRHMRHVWSEPKSVARIEAPGPLLALGENYEPIDFDWWEPRYDQPWRRQVARDREEFGGYYVARPKSPVEGPNNLNRLRRELKQAEQDWHRANADLAEAEEEATRTHERMELLKERVAP